MHTEFPYTPLHLIKSWSCTNVFASFIVKYSFYAMGSRGALMLKFLNMATSNCSIFFCFCLLFCPHISSKKKLLASLFWVLLFWKTSKVILIQDNGLRRLVSIHCVYGLQASAFHLQPQNSQSKYPNTTFPDRAVFKGERFKEKLTTSPPTVLSIYILYHESPSRK